MKNKLNFMNVICGVVFFILGLYTIIYPSFVMNFLSLVIGAILVSFAVVKLYQILSNKYDPVLPAFRLFLTIICLIIGIIFLLVPSTPYVVFAISFGIWALISGATKFSTAMQFYKLGQNTILLFIVSIIHLIFGIFIILFPMFSIELFVRALGAYFIYISICLFISPFMPEDKIIL